MTRLRRLSRRFTVTGFVDTMGQRYNRVAVRGDVFDTGPRT